MVWLSLIVFSGVHARSGTTLAVQDNVVPFVKFSASEYPNARCLDGTLSGLYIRPARNASVAKRWLFVLNGGGLCTTEADCKSRAKGDLGSSDHFATSMDFDTFAWTTSDARNPFADWNLVFVPYCCGSMHSGSKTEATNETFGLYFSGHLSIEAGIQYLSKNNALNQSGSVVVFGGGSAGGIGAFANYEFVASMLPEATVLGAPIGGFPPDVHWFTGPFSTVPEDDCRTPAFQHHVNLYGAYMNQRCVAATAAHEQYKCLVPRFLYQHLQVPVFITEALTDSVVLSGFEGLDPKDLFIPAGWKYINEYGHNATANFQQVLNSTRDGVFAPSCLLHCGFKIGQPVIRGTDAVTALYSWVGKHAFPHEQAAVQNDNFMWIDSCKSGSFWPPCGSHCPLTPDYQASFSSAMTGHFPPLVV